MKSRFDMQKEIKIYVDGCGPRTLGATKQGGIAAVLIDSTPGSEWSVTVKERHVSLNMTSNMAEFLALKLGLEMAEHYQKAGVDAKWIILSDSTYTVSSFREPSYVNKAHLKPIASLWYEIAARMNWNVVVRHIPGEDNIADRPSREAIDNELAFFHDEQQ